MKTPFILNLQIPSICCLILVLLKSDKSWNKNLTKNYIYYTSNYIPVYKKKNLQLIKNHEKLAIFQL